MNMARSRQHLIPPPFFFLSDLRPGPLGTRNHVPSEVGHGPPSVGISGGLLAASLPDGDAGRDALRDGRAAEHVEGLRPSELWLHARRVRPPAPESLAVELGGLFASRQAGRRAWSEPGVC